MAPKKDKKNSMSLAEFNKVFQDSAPSGTASSSWADDDIILPSAPMGLDRPNGMDGGIRSGFGPVNLDEVELPKFAPFKAYLGNLSYEAGEVDVCSFFGESNVKSVFFPSKGETGPRGYAYIEFYTLEALKEGLLKSGQTMGGRPVKVDISNRQSSGSGYGMKPGLVAGNWREGSGKTVERSSFVQGQNGGGFGSTIPVGSWREPNSTIPGRGDGVGFVPSKDGFASSKSRINALVSRDSSVNSPTSRDGRGSMYGNGYSAPPSSSSISKPIMRAAPGSENTIPPHNNRMMGEGFKNRPSIPIIKRATSDEGVIHAAETSSTPRNIRKEAPIVFKRPENDDKVIAPVSREFGKPTIPLITRSKDQSNVIVGGPHVDKKPFVFKRPTSDENVIQKDDTLNSLPPIHGQKNLFGSGKARNSATQT